MQTYFPVSSLVKRAVLGMSVFSLLAPSLAIAAPLPFFDTIPAGRAEFDLRVNSANGALYTHALSGLASNTNSWAMPDFTITSTNNANRLTNSFALNNFSGLLAGTPGGDSVGMNADGTTGSGLTFTFNNAINGFGLDLEGWATCCYPSGLYVSFDGGTPILVGSAANRNENPGAAAGHGPTTFVGAIDDAGTFSVVTFYGLASGDAMNAGGIIRYALVPLGSISGGGGGYVQTTQGTSVQGLGVYFKDNEGAGGTQRQIVSAYLDTLNTKQATEALKTIFPVNTSVTSQSMLSSSGQTSSVLMEKVGTVLGSTMAAPMNFANGSFNPSAWLFGDGNARPSVAGESDLAMSLASSPYKKFDMGQQALWFQGVGAYANGDDTSTTIGYETTTAGVVGGYEFAIDSNHLVGVVASNFWSDVDLDDKAGKTEARNYNLGLYGQKLLGETKLTAVVSGGYGDYESVRHINLGGVTANPEADYNGWSASSSLSVSHLFTHDTIKIEPFAQVSYTHVWTDGYEEKNGGAFNMNVSSDKFSTAGAKIGVNLENEYNINDRKLVVGVKPYVGKQWEIEAASNTTRLVGSANETTINGRDMDTFDVGLTLQAAYDIDDSTTLKIGSDLSRDKYEERAVGFVGVGFKF